MARDVKRKAYAVIDQLEQCRKEKFILLLKVMDAIEVGEKHE